MASSPETHEHTKQTFLEEPSLLDWYSMAPDPDTKVSANNVASALGLLGMIENLREGYDIEFAGTDKKILAQTIGGIHRRDVQAFRESETYPYTGDQVN